MRGGSPFADAARPTRVAPSRGDGGWRAAWGRFAEAFRMAVVQGKLAYEEAGTSQQNIMKLVAGRIDCYVNDRVSIYWEYERLRRRGQLTGDHPGVLVEGAVVSREYGYLGFGAGDEKRFPFRNDFLREFNDAIRALRGSGEIAKIVEAFLAP